MNLPLSVWSLIFAANLPQEGHAIGSVDRQWASASADVGESFGARAAEFLFFDCLADGPALISDDLANLLVDALRNISGIGCWHVAMIA
jgi:hypothetical protein